MKEDLLNRVLDGESLTRHEAEDLMGRMMDEELTPVQLTAFLIALRAKGETPTELAGFARVMRSRSEPLETSMKLADTCGTGGDGAGTFNISTAAALIVAACGVSVAKHGNRAASSLCGSADVLEALGVEIALGPDGVQRCIEEAGIGFLFAPTFHPAMKFAAGPRRELGVRTLFNLLGPLTNPTRPSYQLLGVSSRHLLDLMAAALLDLGTESALVVHGQDGTDEISVAGPTEVREVREGKVSAYVLEPSDFGLGRSTPGAVRGGSANANARILTSILEGERGPVRDAAIANAAGCLYASRKVHDLGEGAAMATQALDSGQAKARLVRLQRTSQEARRKVDRAA